MKHLTLIICLQFTGKDITQVDWSPLSNFLSDRRSSFQHTDPYVRAVKAGARSRTIMQYPNVDLTRSFCDMSWLIIAQLEAKPVSCTSRVLNVYSTVAFFFFTISRDM